MNNDTNPIESIRDKVRINVLYYYYYVVDDIIHGKGYQIFESELLKWELKTELFCLNQFLINGDNRIKIQNINQIKIKIQFNNQTIQDEKCSLEDLFKVLDKNEYTLLWQIRIVLKTIQPTTVTDENVFSTFKRVFHHNMCEKTCVNNTLLRAQK